MQGEVLTQTSKVHPLLVCQVRQQGLHLNRPVTVIWSGLAAVAMSTGAHKLPNSQQQRLLTTHLAFSDSLHASELLLSKIKATALLERGT
jgi:hypothetical protein